MQENSPVMSDENRRNVIVLAQRHGAEALQMHSSPYMALEAFFGILNENKLISDEEMNLLLKQYSSENLSEDQAKNIIGEYEMEGTPLH